MAVEERGAALRHLAIKVSGALGVVLMLYCVLVPRGTLQRMTGGSSTTQQWTVPQRLQCCTCSSVPEWQDSYVSAELASPAAEGGEANYSEETQRAEKRSALSSSQREAPRPDYMLDTNAVCDGSSCGVRTAFTDAARRAARQRQHGAARRGLLDSADSEADVPTTATHITPPPFTIILGLHHKTALVDGIYTSLAEYAGLRTVKVHHPDLARQESYTQDEVLQADIVSDWHLGCHLPVWFGGACASITDVYPVYRMIHLFRDPVEVVISGYLYHKHGPEGEAWLRRPDERYNGLSYYSYLHSLSEVDGIKAEVENAIWEINMYATAYTIAAEDPHAINIQLESFSEDFNGTATRMLAFTGMDPAKHPEYLRKAQWWDISRWNPKWRDSEHLTATYKNVDRNALRSVFVTDPELNGTFTNLRSLMGYTK